MLALNILLSIDDYIVTLLHPQMLNMYTNISNTSGIHLM